METLCRHSLAVLLYNLIVGCPDWVTTIDSCHCMLTLFTISLFLTAATGVIVAAVVVPTLILALMVFVIIFGAVCYCVKSGKKDNYR